jgi:hypothetical protein
LKKKTLDTKINTQFRIFILLSISILTLSCWQNENTSEPKNPGYESTQGFVTHKSAADSFEQSLILQKMDTVRRNDRLGSMLMRLGIDRNYTGTLVACFDSVSNHRKIRSDRQFALYHSADSSGSWFCYWPEKIRRVRIGLPFIGRTDILENGNLPAMYSASLDSVSSTIDHSEIHGVINSSLYLSLLEQDADPLLAVEFSDICQWDIDFLIDVRKGDRYWLLVERSTFSGSWLDDDIVKNGKILAAKYCGARDTVMASHNTCGTAGYYNFAGESFQKQFLRSPISYRRVSRGFGYKKHPILKKVRLHAGVDYVAATGTPVVSSADGVIDYIGWMKGYGKVVRVKHGSRYKTLYGHLSAYAKSLSKGTQVKQNQVIAFVGSTGISTGPHLHYEFIEHGKSINPSRIQNQPIAPLDSMCRLTHQEEFTLRFEKYSRSLTSSFASSEE